MLTWEDIDTVLLDMDGTLIDLHFDNYFWQQLVPLRWGQSRGLSLDEARAALEPGFQQVAGTLDWYCLDYWQQQLGLDIMALKREISSKIRWREDVRPVLSQLRACGKRLYLFTNAHPDSLALKCQHTGLDAWLDGLYSTHPLGYSKEHPACWQALQDQLAFDPARTLFIDDSARILQAARDFGIAQIVGIRNPDSQKPAQTFDNFDSITHYQELLPGLATPS